MSVWKFAQTSLQQSIPVSILIVTHSHGSSPGRAGFMMTINANDEMTGSVGGGMMEQRLAKQAKQMAIDNAKPILQKKIHKKSEQENPSGLICSGEQTVAIYPLNQSHLDTIEIINNAEHGVISCDENGIHFITNKHNANNYSFEQSNNSWGYQENVGPKQTLYIIGGGHVGLAVSKIFSHLDFRVEIFDNRDNVITMQNNSYADKKYFIPYAQIGEYIKQGENSYVAIMTFSFPDDEMTLRQLLNHDLKYLGMMGSAAKINKIYNNLKKSGISTTLLKKIRAPIGIQIHSKTPEEIGISVAAEIIRLKNKPV